MVGTERTVAFGPPGAVRSLTAYGDAAASVELKTLIAAPGSAVAEALTARRRPRWRTRWLFLLDTDDVALTRAGVPIRLRHRARDRFDLTVRVRRWLSDPHEAPGAPSGARVEFDLLLGSMCHSADLRRDLHPDTANAALAGHTPGHTLLSPQQRAWARDHHHPPLRRALERLVVHGPLVVDRVSTRPAGSTLTGVRIESCRFPTGRSLVEVSTRCRPSDTARCAEALSDLLRAHDLPLAATQRTKTSAWIEEIDPDGYAA